MIFEIYSTGEKNQAHWLVRHVLTGSNVMGNNESFVYKEQAEAYVKELEAGPFIWHFDKMEDLMVLNDYDEVLEYVEHAYKRAEQVK